MYSHLFIASILYLKHLLGKQKSEPLPKTPHEAPPGMLVSPVILCFTRCRDFLYSQPGSENGL